LGIIESGTRFVQFMKNYSKSTNKERRKTMDNTPNPFSRGDHPISPGSGSSGHDRLEHFRHWNYHVMGSANIAPEQRDVTKLIESISDSDIDNLREKTIRRGIEQSQNPNIPIKDRQQYEANKDKYVTVFRSIRENLRGKSSYERVKAIQTYLLGDKNDAKRKIFEELLRGKTSGKGKEHTDQSSLPQPAMHSEMHYRQDKASGSNRQLEVPPDRTHEPSYLIIPISDAGGNLDRFSLRAATDSRQLEPENRNEPGIHLTVQDQIFEVYIPWELIRYVNDLHKNRRLPVLQDIQEELNTHAPNSIYDTNQIPRLFSAAARGTAATIGYWHVRIVPE
jgi:hypothetical protein